MVELVVIAIVVSVVIAFLSVWSWRGIPKQFVVRGCQGAAWRAAFPSATKLDIREFLELFTGAFLFPSKERLKFGPNDGILSVYKAVYGRQNLVDAMELETLAVDVESKYGVQLSQVWSERLTLGELFASIQARRAR